MTNHTGYVNRCSEMVKNILFRKGSLREALISAAENCFDHFPIREVPYGDDRKCEEIMNLITDNGSRSIAETIDSMNDNEIRIVTEKIFELNIDLIGDEATQKVDNLWKITYLRSMKFHN